MVVVERVIAQCKFGVLKVLEDVDWRSVHISTESLVDVLSSFYGDSVPIII